jgi:hypothetical protein
VSCNVPDSEEMIQLMIICTFCRDLREITCLVALGTREIDIE